MRELIRRVSYLLHRRRFDRELASEMEFHREMASRSGGAPFGSALRLHEEAREAWGWTWLERLVQDLRYAGRQLRRSPGFTLSAILMLVIGIGVNVAAFGFFNLIVLRPLPVRDPGTLLRFKRHAPQSYAWLMPYAEMAFFREHTKTLSAVIAVNSTKLAIDGESKPLLANFVTPNFFNELGAQLALGREFDAAEDGEAGAEAVVVLSRGFWQRHFGANPAIVGKTIRLNDKAATVIGVATSAFSGLSMEDPDVWIPIEQQPYFVTGSRLLSDFSISPQNVTMFGRLRPGVSASAAEGELAALAAVLHQQHPADIWEKETLPSYPGGYAKNVGGGRSGSGTEKRDEAYPAIAIVSALSLLILIVACGNLASLLLARGIAREREIWIRKSVGAGHSRLIRQLFTESLLLALLGSGAGLFFGYFLLRAVMTMARAPAWLTARPDWRVVLFALAAGFFAAILFGLTPAFQIARQRHRSTRARHVLIGVQIAASYVLVIVAALLIRALNTALTAHPGFEYHQIVSIDPGLATHSYSAGSARAYLDTLRSRLAALPGVEAVTMNSVTPLGNKKVTTGADIEGRSIDVHMYGIDPQFFSTMKIPLLRGRNLRADDTRALVISRSFAVQWPGGNPIGRPFQMGSEKYTVVGVVGTARLVALEDADAVEAYYLAPKEELPSMVVLLRTSGPSEGLLPFVSSLARSIDPKVLPNVQLIKESFQRKMEGAEYAALSGTALGLVALLIAAVGIAGLVSYAVSQRTKEIGISMSLGATRPRVLSMVVKHLTWPILVGSVAGLFTAAGLTQLLRGELYGVSAIDPSAYLIATLVFTGIVTASALLPARRALRVDVLTSLRHE